MTDKVIDKMNLWGRNKTPFLVLVDFELKKPKVWKLDNIQDKIKVDCFRQVSHDNYSKKDIIWKPQFVSYQNYSESFNKVKNNLIIGNSFLTNLTFKSIIDTNLDFDTIFHHSVAPFNLLFKDNFVCFSPEPFITIKNNKVSTFPMKGTINADNPRASQDLLDNQKELEEHVTVVDLLRNDLSIISDNVYVKSFRYIDHIKTNNKNILQASSEVEGDLKPYYKSNLGDLFFALLPAGSVSGAPKNKTLQIISDCEDGERGYFAGVCGIWDGVSFVSFVLIRFIEICDGQMIFRSGGGITCKSDCNFEYEEMKKKVYYPW